MEVHMSRSEHSTSESSVLNRRTMLKSLGAAGVAFTVPPLLSGPLAHADTGSGPVTVDWNGPSVECVSTPTLQVVVNPLIQRGSPIHQNVFRSLGALNAEYVRFVPWYPYPKLGVAELAAPTADHTSWDFSLIDPIVEDFMSATAGRSTILNFSTTPEWMWMPVSWTVANGALHAVGADASSPPRTPSATLPSSPTSRRRSSR
jgi:hypothetical protein